MMASDINKELMWREHTMDVKKVHQHMWQLAVLHQHLTWKREEGMDKLSLLEEPAVPPAAGAAGAPADEVEVNEEDD